MRRRRRHRRRRHRHRRSCRCCCWPISRMRILCHESRIPFFAYTVLSRYGQGSIKLLNYSQHLNSWYIFYTNPTLNNTPCGVV